MLQWNRRNIFSHTKIERFPYRQGVKAFVIDTQGNFLLVQKQSYGKNQWNIPGGGLEDGETIEKGILRELEEELGTHDFKILAKSPHVDRYEWPEKAQEKGHKKQGKWWRGQENHQYLVEFSGKKEKIKLQEEEIRVIKWVPYRQLKLHMVFDGQWNNARETLEDFKNKGLL